jgi:hypothetical protein
VEGPLAFWLGLVGAVVGGAAGYLAFDFIFDRGVILWPLPGVLVGLGRALFSRQTSWVLGILCFVIALAVTLHLVDTRLLRGLEGMGVFEAVAVLAGALIALWFGVGRSPAKP